LGASRLEIACFIEVRDVERKGR